MLKNSKAFSSFSVDNLESAKSFYNDTLGMETKTDKMGNLELHTNGNNPIMIYSKDNHEPATFTVLNLPVEDIEQAVDELNNKGISFEQYDFMGTNEKGISKIDEGFKMAWFKDPAGNIISLIQEA